eukprot:GEMP01007398.1.p1 GENE.GEMP01007398.1~~GEMP01007398.1.p1  ORF type:complete len:527 (+),score=113.71 GEMP01007398.1:119-1699(+)
MFFLLVLADVVAAALPSHAIRGISQLHATPRHRFYREGENLINEYCTEAFYEQRIDQFGNRIVHGKTHFKQRYYECIPRGVEGWKAGDPVFFYTGNENDVDLYVNLTGLMWEHANDFGAKLIFAEHRYFGRSYPFAKDSSGRLPHEDVRDPSKMRYLTTAQALADFNELILEMRGGSRSAYIGFGGSYGGMLCTWLRMKYPDSIQGCIAGSAPVLNFEGIVPPFPSTAFAQLETFDATPAAGAAAGCNTTISRAWNVILATSTSVLQKKFSLCDVPTAASDVVNFFSNVLGLFAMGSYPFPSNYMTWGDANALLPPYPMHVGCDILQRDGGSSDDGDLLDRLGEFAAVYYNATKDKECFDVVADDDVGWALLWNVLVCTGMVIPQGTDGKTDMFWKVDWDLPAFTAYCKQQFGLTPDTYYVARTFGNGTHDWVARKYSNIFFSNGEYDPWITGGVNKLIPGGKAVDLIPFVIANNGHHADLMFAHELDTDGTLQARLLERALIKKWIAAYIKEDDQDVLRQRVFYA